MSSSTTTSKETETTSFLSAASKPVEEIKEDKNALNPGWVSLSYQHNKLVKKENLSTKSGNKTLDLQSGLAIAIENIENRRQKNIDYYNGLYGEGEYQEKFTYGEEKDDEECEDDLELYSD